MIRIAQLLSLCFTLIFLIAASASLFFPETIGQASGFNPISDYGLTNIRTLGAPLLSLAVVTSLALLRKDWILLLPASLYFLFNGSARVISLFNEQYDPIMLRGLMLTFGLFILSQLALHTFRIKYRQ
ncbi:hypothetical protein [uncultured Shewanella sp.]|uniref:hypothetical protein n=1 Tax=uncultured Shewanella sp. TaxID=173975 RepID=UPI00260AEF4A|nr:hypothetical protein [uncultured Shewanella sp.]